MNTIYRIYMYFFVACTLLAVTACEEEGLGNEETPFAPYVFSLGINSNRTTTYYVVTAPGLISGTISTVGKGVKQNGCRDYEQGEQIVLSIDELGLTSAAGIVRDAASYLAEYGDFVFNSSLNTFTQMDGQAMIGLEPPANKENGDKTALYTVNASDTLVASQVRTPIFLLGQLKWPSITGMYYSEGNVYVAYFPMNPTSFETLYTDITFVAVYSYSDMKFETLMKGTRTGPAGSWNAFNGIFKVKSGDMCVMSNSAITNGFSQGTKNTAFLRIPKGETRLDDYYLDFETVSGGLKSAHIKYVGNGSVSAEVNTISPQTPIDRWGDKSLECCVIDLNNKTVRDIEEIPVHNGDGGRRFAALVDGGYVYRPVTTSKGTYIYQVDLQITTMVRGAKVLTTFVDGFFHLDR